MNLKVNEENNLLIRLGEIPVHISYPLYNLCCSSNYFKKLHFYYQSQRPLVLGVFSCRFLTTTAYGFFPRVSSRPCRDDHSLCWISLFLNLFY